MSPETPSPEDRLRALEEAQGFADHTTDQLSAEIERAFALIKRLEERVDAMERRLQGVDRGSAEPE